MASADLSESLRRRWAPAARLITFLIACTWVGVSAVLAFAPPFRAEWFTSRDVIEAEFLLAKQSSLCGILLYDYGGKQEVTPTCIAMSRSMNCLSKMALLEMLEILIGEMKAGKFDYSRQANEQCPQEQTGECPVIFMDL